LSLEEHRVELVLDLGLENGVTGDGGRHVLSLLLRLGVLLSAVLLVKLVGDPGLENGVTGDGDRHVHSLLLRLGVLLNSVLLVSLHVNLVLGTGVGRQRVLGVLLRLVGLLTLVVLDVGTCGPRVLGAQSRLSGLLTLVVLGELLVNLVPTQAWNLLISLL
jgi:hypothetical protein